VAVLHALLRRPEAHLGGALDGDRPGDRLGVAAPGRNPGDDDGEQITVAELARIVEGKHKPLWEPIETGFWIRYRIDTVSSLDQQYRP